MTTPKDLGGVFWLPEHREEAVAGHLVSAEGRVHLELHGTFPGFQGRLGDTYPLIHGIGDATTLLTLYRGYTSGARIGAVMQQRISIGLVLEGEHFSEDELSFSEVRYSTDHLADWAARTGIVHTNPPPKEMRWQVGFAHPEPLVADLGERGTVRIEYDGRMRDQRGTVELSESPKIICASPKLGRPHELLSDLLPEVRDLLTFATMSPSYLEDVVLRSPNAVHVLPSGKRHEVDIEVWHTLLQPEDRDRILDRLWPNRMLFALADWPHDFTQLIASWLDMRTRHRSSMNLLMGLAYAPPRWEETRVLTLAQALEAYHRTRFDKSPVTQSARQRKARVLKAVKPVLAPDDRSWLRSKLDHSEDPSHRERLSECAARVAAIVDPMVLDLDAFSKDLSKVRHTYSHLGAPDSGDESARRDHVLGRRAYWVLVTNFLLDLGFTNEQARSLITRNHVFEHDLTPEWIDLG